MDISEKDALIKDASKIVEQLGGKEAILESLRAFSRRSDRMIELSDELRKRYPDKWVALLDDDEVIVGDDLDFVWRKVDERGISRSEAIVKLMETNPRIIIV